MNEVLRPDKEYVPKAEARARPEPKGPLAEEDQPWDAAFNRQLQSAKTRYKQDATPVRRPAVRVEVQQRAGFNREEYKAFNKDVIEEENS
jgi:hypothetical protein